MADRIWLDRLEATWPYQRLRYAMNHGLVAFFSRRVFAGRNGLRIAEVACGSGYAAHLMAQQPEVALSVAADLNTEDYRQAQIHNFQGSFVLMDLFKPATQTAAFDLVWNSSSIEEIDRPEEALKSMAGMAKPGGRVFVGVPNRYGPAGWLRRLSSARTRSWLGRVYSHEQLRELIESAGLTVERQHSYLFGIFIGVLARK
jgi:SAM-dependent methyltransferase